MNRFLIKRTSNKIARIYKGFCTEFFPSTYYRKDTIRAVNRISKGDTLSSKKLSPIPRIVIEASNTCNLNCAMCKTLMARRPKAEISLELFEHLVKITRKEFGQRILAIHTVGEPFMYSRLSEIFRICSEQGMHLTLTTNGLLLDRHMPIFKKYPLVVKHIAFSIDGATAKSYEMIRKGGNFNHLIENLDMLKDFHHKAKAGFSLSCQACLTKENFKEIPLFYQRFVKYFGIDNMLFGFISSLSAEYENNACYKDAKAGLGGLYRRNYPCKLLWEQTHILHDGMVSACCRDYNGELIVGDVRKRSIMDIWNGTDYAKLREKNLKGDIGDLTPCSHCYMIDRTIALAFNNFLKYIFTRYSRQENEFYVNKINQFLEFIIQIKNNKEKVTDRKLLHFKNSLL